MDFAFLYVTFLSLMLIFSGYMFIKAPETKDEKHTKSFFGYLSIIALLLWSSELIDLFGWPVRPISDIIYFTAFLVLVILNSLKIIRKYNKSQGFKSVSDEAHIVFCCSLGALLIAMI